MKDEIDYDRIANEFIRYFAMHNLDNHCKNSYHPVESEDSLEENTDYYFNTANTPNTIPFPVYLANHTLISNLTEQLEQDYLHLYSLMPHYESL